MITALLLTVCSILPHDADTLRDQVDVVELNRFYDDEGRHVFDQVIWYDWEIDRHQVTDWRLVKGHEAPQAMNGRWASVWYDNDRLRIVEATSKRETWTQFDPELAEREVRPKEKRRGLSK